MSRQVLCSSEEDWRDQSPGLGIPACQVPGQRSWKLECPLHPSLGPSANHSSTDPFQQVAPNISVALVFPNSTAPWRSEL